MIDVDSEGSQKNLITKVSSTASSDWTNCRNKEWLMAADDPKKNDDSVRVDVSSLKFSS